MKQQCFLSLKNWKKQLLNFQKIPWVSYKMEFWIIIIVSYKIILNFQKISWVSYKMETQKIINLLNDLSNEEFKFAIKKRCVIDSQTAECKYKQGDTIKFQTESIKSSLFDYSDTFILVTKRLCTISYM